MSAVRRGLAKLAANDGLNFTLTNRIPRRAATRFVGWFSRIEQPLVRDASIALWRLFSELDLSDARSTRFRSLHDCFTRRLRDGARPVDADPAVLVSPCDAIVGACGTVRDGQVLQVKGSAYRLRDLLQDDALCEAHRDGCYVTLRLTAAMYHHFHAPHDGRVESVDYIPGDAWNVNPPALRRVPSLYCRNERAVIRMRLAGSGLALTLVPVAAILVAGLRLCFLPEGTSLRAGGARRLACAAVLRKGEEMGWFEHGSTIVLLAPAGCALAPGVAEGAVVRAGRVLLRLPEAPGG
jgi:phosphatidylserine decarboxylase